MRMNDMILLYEAKDLEGEPVFVGAYGPHLLMDCHGCNPDKFNRDSIKKFMKKLVKAIDMDAEDFHFWDDIDVPEDERRTEPQVVGTTIGGVIKKKVGIQFIINSSIVIHTLDILKRVYVDIFSCKLFNEGEARKVVQDWFEADTIQTHLIIRT